jgi:hypothetical protein
MHLKSYEIDGRQGGCGIRAQFRGAICNGSTVAAAIAWIRTRDRPLRSGMNAKRFLDTALAGRRAWREAQTVMREIVEQNPEGGGNDDDFEDVNTARHRYAPILHDEGIVHGGFLTPIK